MNTHHAHIRQGISAVAIALALLQTMSVAAVSQSRLLSDDFSEVLNNQLWAVEDPLNDSQVFTSNGRLVIDLPAGSKHNLWRNIATVPRVMQSVTNIDFEVETALEINMTERQQIAGILVDQDRDNRIRLDVNYTGSRLQLVAVAFVGQEPIQKFRQEIEASSRAKLKLRRFGKNWTLYYGYDDGPAVKVGEFEHDIVVTRVGLFAGNTGSNNPPAYTATFDYFKVSGLASDEFDDPVDPLLWHFLDPNGVSHVESQGGSLNIDLPTGVSHDLWKNALTAPRLLQASNNEDFDVEVKVDSPMTSQYQVAGLVVQNQDDSLLRYDVYYDGSRLNLVAARIVNNRPKFLLRQFIAEAFPVYLRLQRDRDDWRALYSYDGAEWTEAGTFTTSMTVNQVGVFAANPNSELPPAYTAMFDYFTVHKAGTPPHVELVKDIWSGSDGSGPDTESLYEAYQTIDDDGLLTFYFSASDEEHGRELWKSDGTAAGTRLVKDLKPGPDSGSPRRFSSYDGHIYFLTGLFPNMNVWRTDGTEAGTVVVEDVDSLPDDLFLLSNDISRRTHTVFVDGIEYFLTTLESDFSINRYKSGILWKNDGSGDGPVVVKDFGTVFDREAYPNELTNVNGTLYFSVHDEDLFGYSLWKSDGTTNGTQFIIEFGEGFDVDGVFGFLAELNGRLFFAADESQYGAELWTLDETSGEPVIFKDFIPGGGLNDGHPTYLRSINGHLYFFVADGVHGRELWRTDGTLEGTVLIKDVFPGATTGVRIGERMFVFNGSLYFVADDGVHGRELWKVTNP